MTKPIEPIEAESRHNGGAEQQLQISMLIYPEMTAIDVVAPQLVFANLPNAKVDLVWKDLNPVPCDSGYSVLPTATLETVPETVDLLFVGGSKHGTWPLLHDAEITSFLADRGARAKWVTSVCTGALLLAAAGLLDGYSATSYWAVRHLLAEFGAIPVDDRVVHDRNRITGGGVTSGMDFALYLAATLCGEQFAKTLQLLVEYDPRPPFDTGNPAFADSLTLKMANQLYASEIDTASESVRSIATRSRYGRPS